MIDMVVMRTDDPALGFSTSLDDQAYLPTECAKIGKKLSAPPSVTPTKEGCGNSSNLSTARLI